MTSKRGSRSTDQRQCTALSMSTGEAEFYTLIKAAVRSEQLAGMMKTLGCNAEAVARRETMTMSMTMTHSEKSAQQSLEAWPHRQERRGHDPVKKSLLQLMWLALLARFARTHCS